MPEVITAGETMVLAVPSRPGRLRHAAGLELKVGGAESNVAIALSRLGISTGWISQLGDDEPGQLVLDRIRAEGVDVSQVQRVEGSQTGLYLREKIGDQVRVYYYRGDSAASRLAPKAFDPAYLDGARFLHLSGTTPALSATCRDFSLWLVREAHAKGVPISFDVNYRSKLWSAPEARDFAEEVLSAVSILFVSAEDAGALWGREDDGLTSELAEKGPSEVVLKRGAGVSVAYTAGTLHSRSAFSVGEVDPIGAGDAFAAGYLAAALWGFDCDDRLRVANAMGAYSVQTLGDYEGLPGREELTAFVHGVSRPGR